MLQVFAVLLTFQCLGEGVSYLFGLPSSADVSVDDAGGHHGGPVPSFGRLSAHDVRSNSRRVGGHSAWIAPHLRTRKNVLAGRS